jgi:membrane associated rhomboid family serine protease
VATGVAVVAAVVQYAVPAVVPVLERAPDAPHEWWRWGTSLLVQTLGVHQVLANLVTLALVGVVAERLLGRTRWVLVFVTGTVGGQVAAFVQGEPGGGSSIAICGLAGGVLGALLAAPGPVPRLPAQIVTFYIVALTGWGLDGVRGTALLIALAERRSAPPPRRT